MLMKIWIWIFLPSNICIKNCKSRGSHALHSHRLAFLQYIASLTQPQTWQMYFCFTAHAVYVNAKSCLSAFPSQKSFGLSKHALEHGNSENRHQFAPWWLNKHFQIRLGMFTGFFMLTLFVQVLQSFFLYPVLHTFKMFHETGNLVYSEMFYVLVNLLILIRFKSRIFLINCVSFHKFSPKHV